MSAAMSLVLALVPSLSVLAEPSLPAAVLALVVAALCAGGGRVAGHLVRVAVVAPRSSYDERPLLRGRATDPVHHPQRPRAPGTA